MKRLVVVGLVFLMLVLVSLPVLAKPGDVVVGDLVARFRVPVAGLSPAERASIVDARVVEVLSNVRTISVDRVKIVRGHRCLMIRAGRMGEYPLVTITARDAKANGDTIRQLAVIWRDKFIRGLKMTSPYDR